MSAGPRIGIRVILLSGGALAAGVIPVALYERGGTSVESWATVAACLAVISALISAWSSQRLLELQEDSQRPDVEVSFDFRSRYGLAQLRVMNRGLLPAYDVSLTWNDPPLVGGDGKPITLGSAGLLPVLRGGESAAFLLDGAHEFLSTRPLTYSGTLTFRDGAGVPVTTSFALSAEHESGAMEHTAEEPKTLYELQQIPDALRKIATAIANVRKS